MKGESEMIRKNNDERTVVSGDSKREIIKVIISLIGLLVKHTSD